MNNSVLILGATSDVGKALALHYSKMGYAIILAARNTNEVQTYIQDWSSKQIQVVPFEATDFAGHQAWVKNLPLLPTISICVFGYLGDHEKARTNWSEAHRIIDANYTGAVSILNRLALEYEKQGSGCIVGISSVAGDRGRQSNYFYGSAKAGFTAYLSGLRNRLFHKGVHVLTVKPGFINTSMTAGLKLPKPITASADQVATRIISAVQRKRNTIYVLSAWFWIMLVIRNIPEFIFKKLKL